VSRQGSTGEPEELVAAISSTALALRGAAMPHFIMTALFSHSACLDHDTGRRHPEAPARLVAVLEALSGTGSPALTATMRPEQRATIWR